MILLWPQKLPGLRNRPARSTYPTASKALEQLLVTILADKMFGLYAHFDGHPMV